MKKIIATLLLVAVMVLSMASCGAINKDGEVSVIWSDLKDEYLATIADALDRAMYIENINYTHYDAEGSDDNLTALVDSCIANGASALTVSVDDLITAGKVLEKAKNAGIPLVFLCSAIDLPDSLLSSYDKCVTVNVDHTTLYTVLGERIAEDLIENYDKYDRNKDGKISYAAFGISALAVDTINEKLAAASKPELVAQITHMALPTANVSAIIDSIFDGYDGSGDEINETPVELILTDDDAYAEELILALREYELNHKKLITHYIPVYTVGLAANASVLEYGPVEGELSEDDEKMRAAYSVMSAIDDGFISAAALENDDEIALSAAAILKNFFKGNGTFDSVNAEYLKGDAKVLVPYTIY